MLTKVKAILQRMQSSRRRVAEIARVEASGYFSADWYNSAYPDVAADAYWRLHGAEHYLRFGAAEGRDPAATFSSSGYRYLHQLSANDNPLLHALDQLPAGEASTVSLPLYITLKGEQVEQTEQPWLLVCAHSSGPQTFGAERSLLDVLQALSELKYNVLLTLPSVCSDTYVQLLRAYVQKLVVLPYVWWRSDRPCQKQTVQLFRQLMTEHKITLCYCNTLVLDEPLQAAREQGVTSVVHVRELPEADADLCSRMAATPQQVRQHLLSSADYFIANSHCVAAYVNASERCWIVANVIDADKFSRLPPVKLAVGDKLNIGLISSNLPKKGLADFVTLAGLLADHAERVRLYLVGPHNDHVAHLQWAQLNGQLSEIVEFSGYVSDVMQILPQLHIVLNLSHFQESFGRTVLEAMAAGRLVVCYDWGH